MQLQQVTVSANFIRPGGQSALKMSVPVQDVPFSLEDYSQSFMQAVDTTRLTDLYGYMSGVQRAGPSGYDISIRGFTSGSTDPNSVLMDGLPGLPARTASPETADLARVEVVKGPASVLYGQDQPGGFINLITKKPQAHEETNVELRADTYDGAGIPFGHHNGYTGIVDTTGALDSSDTLLGRAIVQYTNQQSFREFVLDKDFMVAPSLRGTSRTEPRRRCFSSSVTATTAGTRASSRRTSTASSSPRSLPATRIPRTRRWRRARPQRSFCTTPSPMR